MGVCVYVKSLKQYRGGRVCFLENFGLPKNSKMCVSEVSGLSIVSLGGLRFFLGVSEKFWISHLDSEKKRKSRSVRKFTKETGRYSS